jgi:hypothetical protein
MGVPDPDGAAPMDAVPITRDYIKRAGARVHALEDDNRAPLRLAGE